MHRQAWVAWLMILLQAVLFWYLSDSLVFAVLVVLISFPAVFWRRRWELSSVSLPVIDLVVAVLCGMKWYLAPHDMQNVLGFVLYPLVHSAGEFFLLAQVARLWGRRPDRPLPVYLPILAVLVFVCLGDIDVRPRQRRMYQHASQALVGLTCIYYSLTRRRQEHPTSKTHRWVRPTLSVTVLVVSVFVARESNAWVLRRWSELEQMMMRASATRRVPSNSAYVGFSGQAPLGSLQILKSSLSNETALRVVSEGAPGYLRGVVFDRFNGTNWDFHSDWQPVGFTRSPLPREFAERFPVAGQRDSKYPLFLLRPYSAVEHHPMTIWRESAVEQFIFLPVATKCVQFPAELLSLDRSGVIQSDGLSSSVGITAWLPPVDDRSPKEPLVQPADWEPHQPFELTPDQTTFATERLLQLSKQALDPRVIELATDLFRRCETADDKLRAVKSLLASFTYEPNISVPPGQDPVSYFLLERQAAHCEFFASATAVLLRLGGVPCRYVTGFAGGHYNSLGRYWIVRQQEAHAWVEAYLPDAGWIVVDTTPDEGQPIADDSFQFSYLWDEINLRGQMIRAALATGNVAGVIAAIQLFSMMLVTTIPGWMLIGGVAFLVARKVRFQRRPTRVVVLSEAVIELQVLVQELDRNLTRWNLHREDHETLHQFAERLRHEANSRPILASVAEWYLQYAAMRYGLDPNEATRESLRRQLREVCQGLSQAGRNGMRSSPSVKQESLHD